jgi:hypothetical protein
MVQGMSEVVMGQQEPVMRMLRGHVPVTLLVDIAEPPDAEQVYETEGGTADWLPYPAASGDES